MSSQIFSNSHIEVIVLGAGQDVGRSCIVVRIEDKTIMFDCGVHLGYSDHRKFPDFKQLAAYYPKATSYNEVIDVVIISHFHLDHVGALPYFTENANNIKFTNKIIMTHPTKAISPILLCDWAKIQNSKHRRNKNPLSFNSDDVSKCMLKTIGIALHQTYEISPNFTVECFYAGHVLGAAQCLVKYKGKSVLYTGDYNMTPDRHLGAAETVRCRPDLMISESTYATMIRESRRVRERNFFNKVHECISNGGKVLIPVFALGRAQELMLLLNSYWDRMDLQIPIYFNAGLAQRANDYYKYFVTWCNEHVRKQLLEYGKNVFNFPHIQRWDNSHIHSDKAMVLLATTGMLHAGTSLRVFKEWCHDSKNLVVLPGYCLGNTIGGQVLAGKKEINIEGRMYTINIQVSNLSFSAHADMKGIMQLVRGVQPKNVMLVHGEHKKMKSLKRKIECELALKCYTPHNGQYLKIEPWKFIPFEIERSVIFDTKRQKNELKGHLMINAKEKNIKFMKSENEVFDFLKVSKHEVLFDLFCCFKPNNLKLNESNDGKASLHWLYDTVERNLCNDYFVKMSEKCVQIFECGDDEQKMNEKECVSMYIEENKDETNCNNEKMDIDDDGNGHKHDHKNATSVRIIYPHNLTETAALVQSLVNMTCDSYC